MNRRVFLKSGLASLLIPHGIAVAHAHPRSADHIFYDERFAEARGIARGLAYGARMTPVQSDMTDVWTSGLKMECAEGPVTMAGITTESFHFCLRGMVRSVATTDSRIERISRDLYRWEIRSADPARKRTMA